MVNLPNGETVSISHIGNIKLSDDIWLMDVLYIPGLLLNSILHQLTSWPHILSVN